MKDWHLRHQHDHQADEVREEVSFGVFCVEASEEEKDDRNAGQELLLRRPRCTVVHLLPVSFSLVPAVVGSADPWAAFDSVKEVKMSLEFQDCWD